MRGLSQFMLGVSMFLLSGQQVLAESSATASIRATITTPVTASKESDLEFDGVTFGHLRKKSGRQDIKRAKDPAIEVVARNIVGARFKVSGNPDYAYSITIPRYVTVSVDAHTFTIGAQTCSGNGGRQFSDQGTDAIIVEGTISYGAAANLTIIINDEVKNGLPIIINNN